MRQIGIRSEKAFQDYTLAELDEELDLRARYPEFPQYFSHWETESKRVEAEWKPLRDIRYGLDAQETLDLFKPAESCRGVVIFLHGGQWMRLDKALFSLVTEGYLKSDLAVLNLNYPQIPRRGLSEIVSSVQRAVVWAKSNLSAYGIDPGKLIISGHSSGGHLAACAAGGDWSKVGVSIPPIVGFCAIGGIYDLGAYRFSTFNRELSFDDDAVEQLSPIRIPFNSTLKCLLVIGGNEGREFRRQHDAFARKLRDDGLMVSECVMPEHNHFSIVERIGAVDDSVVASILQMIE